MLSAAPAEESCARRHALAARCWDALVAKLNEVGVPNALLVIPYGDHAYDAFWGSIGGQITRHVLGDCLSRYFPDQND
jgi:hypothetical protein